MPAIPPPPPELAEKRCIYGILITEELKTTLIHNAADIAADPDSTRKLLSNSPPAAVVECLSTSLDFELLTGDVNRRYKRQPCAFYAIHRMNTATGEWYTADLRPPCREGDKDTYLRRFEEATGGLKPEWHSWF